MYQSSRQESKFITSYLNLRSFIGILGVALPPVLIFGDGLFFEAGGIRPTISDYYYSGMGDVFVGVLWAISIFLFSFVGRNILEALLGVLTGLSGLGVALIPCESGGCWVEHPGNPLDGHLVSAALFFILLGAFSFKVFPQSDRGQDKLPRGEVAFYKICGLVIWALLVITAVTIYWCPGFMHDTPLILGLETAMVLIFGWSWMWKGDTYTRGKHLVMRLPGLGGKQGGRRK